MNAHMIRLVEGPLAGDARAANDPVFAQPARARGTLLAPVRMPAAGSAVPTDDNGDKAEPETEDDYCLGGYAGI